MKNKSLFLPGAALLLLCAASPRASGQTPDLSISPGGDPVPQQYNVTVTGDFESKCLLPNEGQYYIDELPHVMVACEGQEVTYTAHASTGDDNIVGWSWTVLGAAASSYTGNEATVLWGSEETGELSVTITLSSGRTFTHRQYVRIVERPVPVASTEPGYDNSHIIYVCNGMDVEFTDISHTQNSDIAGYYWEGCGLTSTARTFRLTSVSAQCTVTHRVYNNCGCYGEEYYYVHVLDGSPLVLDCYGTACEGSTVDYHASSPTCGRYYWTIEGGHLVRGQGTPDITVVWDCPQDGYGSISLDGTLCGTAACQGGLSVRIPVIENGVGISGQTAACQGEAVVYSVPLFGSTYYNWDISPTTGVRTSSLNGANQMTCLFDSAGTYCISVGYRCEFLECGEFRSDTISVTVKPRLEIQGEKEVCLTHAAILTTNAAPGHDALVWKVYPAAGDQPLYTSSPSAQLSSAVIQTAGSYRITAEGPDYCNTASFFLTVKDPPPAPTLGEMDPDNATVACPHSSIKLKATPPNPLYNLEWEPECSTATPQTVSGQEVSVTYADEVCGVRVYHYDRELQCRSAEYYLHTVVPFVLEPTQLPRRLVVCPGTTVVWNNQVVPEQEGVLYEWEIEDRKQSYVTMNGDVHSGPSTLRVENFVSTLTSSISLELYLHRRYCGNEVIDTVLVSILPAQPATPDFTLPSPVCQNTSVNLAGTGCSSCTGGPGKYLWSFSDSPTQQSGQIVSHEFARPGTHTVTLTCNPYDACDNNSYLTSVGHQIKVVEVPPVQSIGYDGTNVFTEPPVDLANYDVHWDHLPGIINCIVPATLGGGVEYTCTVVSHEAPYCSKTVHNIVTPCEQFETATPYLDYCNKTVKFCVQDYSGPIEWTLLSGSAGTPTGNDCAIFPVTNVGTLVVKARAVPPEPCTSSSMSCIVDFLPGFTLEKACSKIVIHNHSKCLIGTRPLTIEVTGPGGTELITFPADQPTYEYPVGSDGLFDFKLNAYNGHTLDCPIGTVTIENTAGLPVTIVTANTADYQKTCDNTALKLTALLPEPHSIHASHWVFGDNNTCMDANANSIYHTFGNRHDGNAYHVTVEVVDENGCKSSGALDIESYENVLKDPSLIITTPEIPLCPGETEEVAYRVNGNVPSFDDTPTTYTWSSEPNTNLPTHETYNTGDYSVTVTNENYCLTEATVNVPFKNQPSAVIVPKKYYYCTGETVTLHGEPDMASTYQYLWTVRNNATAQTATFTSGTVTFPAAASAHTYTYTVNLTVTNGEGCSADADPVTLTVAAAPTAPTVSFDPGQHCLDHSPVRLLGGNPQQALHWSNGDYGNAALFHCPGVAMAYYYDPVTGCRSDSAVIDIPAAPDFDALLSGCYEVCETRATGALPVYGMLPLMQPYAWRWHFNNSIASQAPFGSQPCPLMLPLQGFGSYYLDVNYFQECSATSKELRLQERAACRCDSIDISYELKQAATVQCSLVYDIVVTVCNHSSSTHCFRFLDPLFNSGSGNVSIAGTSFAGSVLNPGGCYSFSLSLVAAGLDPMVVAFRLTDNDCAECTKDFSIDLTPEVNCGYDVPGVVSPLGIVSQDNTIYYSFTLHLSGVANVLAVWSEPASVLNYSASAATVVNGLCAFRKSDMLEAGYVCFYALVCAEGKLCICKFCVPAKELLNIPKSAAPAAGAAGASSPSPSLAPNPATGKVSVMDAPGGVAEVLVMDLLGRKQLVIHGSATFDISGLPAGTYIVRIRTVPDTAGRDGSVTYHKLVKR